MRLGLLSAAIIWIGFSVQADSPSDHAFTVHAKTSQPFTYCIWYRPDLDNEGFLEELKESPPDLFHVGYQIPFKGALGPTYGHELFSDDILPPVEIPKEVERIKVVEQRMHAAGVPRLIPYVYTMAFFGNPERRTGFFHFFDHWEDYSSFGIGPKPPGDPTLWLQSVGPHSLGGGPPDVLHYDPCVNHPAWSSYLDLVVRQLADVDYDGMFHDVNTQCCICPFCQEKFDLYLFGKYGRQGLREAFGTDDARELNISTIGEAFETFILKEFNDYLASIWRPEHLDRILAEKTSDTVKLEEDWRLLRCYMQGSLGEFPPEQGFQQYLVGRFGGKRIEKITESLKKDFVQTVLRHHFQAFLDGPELASKVQERFGSSDIRRRCLSNPRDLLLWVETQRFWCDSMAHTLARLKKVGQQMLDDQGRKEEFYTVANLGPVSTIDSVNKRRVDGIDLVRWAPSCSMQMFEEMQQCGMLESGVILSNIFGFRWAMGAGTRGGTLLYMVGDDRAADLAEAEVAAAGGGAFIQPAVGAPESRKRWRNFFSEHADLWDKGISYARVGLLYWNDQIYYEYPEHLAMTRRLVNIFSETQIPFDIVTEENLASIGGYQVLVLPCLRYLDDTQIDAVLNYARNGGNLIIVGPFGTEDTWARARPLSAKREASSGNLVCEPCGKGRVLRLDSEAVPARRSDFWNLMEERANNFVRARNFLNAVREADKKEGVDLGSGFVQKIERALEVRLRWCPLGTDAGVYVHAYRMPARANRPERLILHAVNYQMPILVKPKEQAFENPDVSPPTMSGEPIVANDVRVKVPLPKGMQVVSVNMLGPVEETGSIPWHKEDEAVEFSIPSLSIYKAVVIDLK